MSKERVVCIDDSKQSADAKVKKGEIYTVRSIINWMGLDWYTFEEFDCDNIFRMKCYRPIDPLPFGEYVESTLMKEVELEEALTPISL